MRTLLRLAAPTAALLILIAVPARAQNASAEVYGNFRYSYGYADAGDSTHWASANNASRLGVRGEISHGELAAFVDMQAGVNIDAESGGDAFTARYYFAGVRGVFGTLVVGRQSTAYKMSGVRVDPFYDTSTLGVGPTVPARGLYGGASFGLSNLTNGFAERTIAYTSPDVHGFRANGAVFLDSEDDHDLGLGLTFTRSGVDIGIQFYDARGSGTWAQVGVIDQAVRVHAAYAVAGSWSGGLSYERVGLQGGRDQDLLYASGTVHVVSKVMLAGAVGYVSEAPGPNASGTGFHLGVFYALFPQVRVHGLFSLVEPDSGNTRSIGAVGFTYDFSIKP